MSLFAVTPFLLTVCFCAMELLEDKRRPLGLVAGYAAVWGMCWGASELCLILRNGLDGELQLWNECCALVQYRCLAPMLKMFPWAFGTFVVLTLLLGPVTGAWRSRRSRLGLGWGLMVLALAGAVLTDFWCLPLRMNLRDASWTEEISGVEVYRPMGLNILYTSGPVTSGRNIPIYERPEETAAQIGTIPQGTEMNLTELCFTRPTTQGGWRYSKKHDGFLRTGDLLSAFRDGGLLARLWLLAEDGAGADAGYYVSPDLWRLAPPINTGACLAVLMLWGVPACLGQYRRRRPGGVYNN